MLWFYMQIPQICVYFSDARKEQVVGLLVAYSSGDCLA